MTLEDVVQIVLVQIVGTAFTGIGVYAAIMANLAQLNARVKHTEDNTNRAHDRIDLIISKG
jgi:hypothetical protein